MADVLIRGLSKDFGRVRAVDDLSAVFPAGQVTGFLGPNGAGKTTTLRVVLGLAAPSAGEALIDGRPYARLDDPRRVVGAVLETTGFHPGRRARDHVRIAARALGAGGARADEVLELVDLAGEADRRVGGYSLGMRQRLALATAMLGDPQVLVLDEPANGLDPAGMAWLRGLVRDLAGRGRAVVISSHVLAEVAQTVDRVVIVSDGRLRFQGQLDDVTVPGETLEAAFLRLTGPMPVPQTGRVAR